MENHEIQMFYPKNRSEWRKWLKKNHAFSQLIWVICYKKVSNKPTISWSDAVDEALCFGWIDSKAKPLDEESFLRSFCKRKPKSVWSKINKAKVHQLIDEGLMTAAGHESVEVAKQNGSWMILDEVEEIKIPKDLDKEFKTKKGSKQFFLSLSRSVKKRILQWLILAKRSDTRQKRINEIVEAATKKVRPNKF